MSPYLGVVCLLQRGVSELSDAGELLIGRTIRLRQEWSHPWSP